MNKWKFTACLILLLAPWIVEAQLLVEKDTFTRADTLRGMLRPERTCYDVVFYDLNIKINPSKKRISGYNDMHYAIQEPFTVLQVDLFSNMHIDAILFDGDTLPYTREADAVFIRFPQQQAPGNKGKIRIYYHGKPREAKRAPWDGGFVWSYDEEGKPWIGVACEGIGASLWWPNKDHLSDEPDSMAINIAVPDTLQCIANGSFEGKAIIDSGYAVYQWFVHYPINNYNVTVNIGNYTSFADTFHSASGDVLSLDYYVLPYNLAKARKHFQQVKPMMRCFEGYFGPYPFPRDGYALVETPYLGMEHQGAIAYGNQYKTGYAGWDYSRIGLDFDYIIIHETGHEWWGNSVSCADIADLWIHEGFCTYAEALYVECMFDYRTALQYINAKKPFVENKRPVIGIYNVNNEGSGDMYNKGMLMLNTLRHVLDNDALWFSIIRGIADDFKFKTTSTDELIRYINEKSGRDLTYFFRQYLYHASIPVFEYYFKGKTLYYRWVADVEDFRMPVKVTLNAPDEYAFIFPTTRWQEVKTRIKAKHFRLAEDLFYVDVREVNP